MKKLLLTLFVAVVVSLGLVSAANAQSSTTDSKAYWQNCVNDYSRTAQYRQYCQSQLNKIWAVDLIRQQQKHQKFYFPSQPRFQPLYPQFQSQWRFQRWHPRYR